MPAPAAISGHARVLGLRLRLGLAELKDIESWADQAILTPGAPTEMADLCLATRAGERITLRILTDLGGPPGGYDLMKALSALRVMEASQDQLRRLADNLHPILTAVDRARAGCRRC